MGGRGRLAHDRALSARADASEGDLLPLTSLTSFALLAASLAADLLFLLPTSYPQVSLFASGFQQQLLEEIDASELPAFLGGAREAPNAVPGAEKLAAGVGDRLRSLQSQKDEQQQE